MEDERDEKSNFDYRCGWFHWFESCKKYFAERFRREIEKMEFIPAGEEERHPITISGGIASYPFLQNVEEDGNTLIRYAEHALYNAKKRGKNKIVQFSQINIEY